MIATIDQPRPAPAAGPPPGSRAIDAPARVRDLAALSVLVIEDEVMIAWMLESLLEDMGFEAIALAASAGEATAAAALRAPDLVISDINLGSGADGIEAVGALCTRGMPAVLFVSAYVDDGARARIARLVPAARILSKPLGAAELSGAVHGLLAAAGRG